MLSTEQLLSLHKEVIEKFGGPGDSIRSIEMLDYIQGKAADTREVFETAATYMLYIPWSQPFADGNKRTGLGSAVILLRMNGYKVTPGQDLKGIMINTKGGSISTDMLREILQARSSKKPPKSFEESKKWFFDKFAGVLNELAKL